MKTIAAVLFVLALSACVQSPTQSTQVVDDRPRLTFDPVTIQGRPKHYEVVIDGISYGSIDQYLIHQNTLRVVAGPHVIELRKDGELVFREDVVLGENTTRVIKVIDNDQ